MFILLLEQSEVYNFNPFNIMCWNQGDVHAASTAAASSNSLLNPSPGPAPNVTVRPVHVHGMAHTCTVSQWLGVQ